MGVPQGSIPGLLLWNILYYPVLYLSFTEGAISYTYADDLAIMVEVDDDAELKYIVKESFREILIDNKKLCY